jgi:hypothetical protein
MANPNQPNLGQTQQEIRDIAAMTEDTFRSVADNIQSMFRDALEQGQNVSRSLSNDIGNNLKSLARLSSDVINNQDKLNKGVLKQADIQKQIQQRSEKINAIENQIRVARLAGLDISQDILEDLEATTRVNQIYINQLLDQQDILDNIDKEIGQLGLGIQGLGTFAKKLGFDGLAKPLERAMENTKAYKAQLIQAQREYDSLINKSEELTEAEIKRKEELEDEIKLLEKKQGRLKNILSSLKEELTMTNAVDFVFANIAKSFLKLNEAQTEFTRETGRNIPHLDTINSSLISSVDYIKTATALTQQFGFAADAVFSKDTIEAASKLQVLMGMSAEEAGNAAVLSKVNGTELKDQSQAVLDQVGAYNKTNQSALNQKGILKDVYSTSQTIQLSLGGNVKKIADANIAARALGLSLKEVEGISDSLLDIESSIANEFEAEVITGKQLNLEAARYYALQNDLEGVAKEIGNNQEVLNTFAKGNRIEQEAVAKAMGLSRDQVSKMIYAKELEAGVTKKQAALNSGMKLEDLERLTVQETITKSMEKMGSALAGPLETLASMLDNMMQFSGIITTVIGSMIVLKTITSTILGIEKTIAAYKAISTARTAAMASLEGSVALQKRAQTLLDLKGLALGKSKLVQLAAQAALWALANPITALVGLGVAAAVGAVAYSMISKAGDVNSPADGKTQISTKEGGLFELSKNDDLVAFPGASKALNSKNAPVIVNQSAPPQQSQSIDYDKMAQAMSRVKVQTNLDGVDVSRGLQKAPLGIATRKI